MINKSAEIIKVLKNHFLFLILCLALEIEAALVEGMCMIQYFRFGRKKVSQRLHA